MPILWRLMRVIESGKTARLMFSGHTASNQMLCSGVLGSARLGNERGSALKSMKAWRITMMVKRRLFATPGCALESCVWATSLQMNQLMVFLNVVSLSGTKSSIRTSLLVRSLRRIFRLSLVLPVRGARSSLW